MHAGEPAPVLIGRAKECEELDRLLDAAHSGVSGALVLAGEPGVGKSALLDYVARRAGGAHVARVSGVESEMELAYAGLHQLSAPLIGRLNLLPPPQRDALSTAFGLRDGDPPDRFIVGLAVLTLLAEAAEERPMVCILDDAQWLDRASLQAFGFVARRLAAEAVVVVFAAREPDRDRDLAGLPQLGVRPLRDEDARALLTFAIPGRLDDTLRDRIVAEAGGNPLALLEVPRAWPPAMLAGGFGLPDRSVARRIDESFRVRLDPLPDATRQLLLVIASESLGDTTVIWNAATSLGIPTDAGNAAVEAGLLEAGTSLRFRHPLVRSVVYNGARIGERQRAHAALAAAIDPEQDPDRRAWHRGLAATGPDEAVALELDQSAERAQRRGGFAAAAAVLGKAAELSVDRASRTERAIAAAQATHVAGSPENARDWLAVAEAGRLDPLQRARVGLLRGQIAFTLTRGADAPRLLLVAAEALEGLNPALARETYLDALVAAQFAGFMADETAREIAHAARAAPAPADVRAVDLLVDGLSLLLTDGRASATPVLRQAVDAFVANDPAATGGYRWLWPASVAALELWDDEAWAGLTRRHVALVREAGALATLPLALTWSIYAQALAGDLAGAASIGDEVESVQRTIGNPLAPYGALLVAAWRGKGGDVEERIRSIAGNALARGEGLGLSTTQWTRALYQNSVGRYASAFRSAREAFDHPSRLTLASRLALVELIEAAARTGQPDFATGALERLAATARPSGSDWGLGLVARSRALLTDDATAEPSYREAVERLGRTHLRGELGRAHLVLGEWLRRGNRRVDARRELRTAHEIFVSIGADAFAERARGELLATGETVRKRSDDTRDELTPQELQIARLARDGYTNPEIAGQLFLSPRTVEWHLRKVFAKLGIASRRELRSAPAIQALGPIEVR